MTPTFTRPATLEDVQYVAANLRQADRDEVLAACGVDPRLALPQYIAERREVWAAGLQSNGRAEILYGVDPIPYVESAAVIWMLSTDVLYDHPVAFAFRSREILDEFHSRFELLTNFIDARNARHIRWLRYMGFTTFRRVERFGAQSLPFIEFASFKT